MKLETILNACLLASFYMDDCETHTFEYYNRQYHAFRDRILRMDKEKDEQEAMLRLTIDDLWNEIDLLKAENIRNELD